MWRFSAIWDKESAGENGCGILNPGPVYDLAEKVFEGWASGDGLGQRISWFIERLEAMGSD